MTLQCMRNVRNAAVQGRGAALKGPRGRLFFFKYCVEVHTMASGVAWQGVRSGSLVQVKRATT